MSSTEFEEELRGRFGWKLGQAKKGRRRLYVTPEKEIFEELVKFLFEESGGRLATITCTDEGEEFKLLYHFSLDERGVMVTVKLPVEKDEEPSTESIAELIPGAEWIEREVREMFGIEFENHPAQKRLLKAESVGDDVYPYRKDFEVEDLEGD